MSDKWKNTKALLNLLNLESNISCSICKNLPENPHTLWCKHSFCKECIDELQKCPCCEFTFKPHDLAPDNTLSKLISAIKAASELVYGRNKPCPRTTAEPHKPNKNQRLEKQDSSKRRKETKPPEQKNIKQEPWPCKTRNRRSESTSPSVKTDQTPLANNAKRRFLQDASKCKLENDALVSSNKKIRTPKNSSSNTSILFSAKKTSINKVNAKGETPLQIACRQGKLAKVQQLLKDGAEPNVKDFANWTPLCDAVGSGNVEIVRALLREGAGVNTPSHLNTTALVEAVLRQDKAMVQLLLSYGADIHQRTSLNNTALSIADDELKALMLASNVPIQPHPRVKTIPKAVFVQELPEDKISKVMELCKSFNLTLSLTYLEEISHIVVVKRDDNLCRGSVEVMQGILHGSCVVGLDWVSASLQSQQLLPPDEFEPNGTFDFPNTNVFQKARLNKENLLPRLFDGCHIALQHEQHWSLSHRQDLEALVGYAGAQFLPRACDAERIPDTEQTVMFHAAATSPLATTSHIVLYQPGLAEPLLKYNMTHIKTLPLTWFLQSIKTFTISL